MKFCGTFVNFLGNYSKCDIIVHISAVVEMLPVYLSLTSGFSQVTGENKIRLSPATGYF